MVLWTIIPVVIFIGIATDLFIIVWFVAVSVDVVVIVVIGIVEVDVTLVTKGKEWIDMLLNKNECLLDFITNSCSYFPTKKITRLLLSDLDWKQNMEL